LKSLSKLLDRILDSRIPPLVKRTLVSLRTARNERRAKGLANRLAQNIRYCNICGWEGKQFNVGYNERIRQNTEATCPNCRSGPPQRALFKYLRENFLTTYLYSIKQHNLLCLEISPARCDPVRNALNGIVYISVDLDESKAMFQMDLTNLTFPDSTFDLVVCSHVLEHIEDDVAAIAQIYRVLKKNGTALIQVPIGYYDDLPGKHTVEFEGRRFYEHCRSYGWDIKEKLMKVGFRVNIIRHADSSVRLDMGNEAIFECRKVME